MRAADAARIFIAAFLLAKVISVYPTVRSGFFLYQFGFNLLLLISVIANLEPEEIKRND